MDSGWKPAYSHLIDVVLHRFLGAGIETKKVHHLQAGAELEPYIEAAGWLGERRLPSCAVDGGGGGGRSQWLIMM